jgi:hypothetical protein
MLEDKYLLKKMAETVMLWFAILTFCFYDFHQSLWANAKTVALIRPLQLPSEHFEIHYSLLSNLSMLCSLKLVDSVIRLVLNKWTY